jgi:hypothetical protein
VRQAVRQIGVTVEPAGARCPAGEVEGVAAVGAGPVQADEDASIAIGAVMMLSRVRRHKLTGRAAPASAKMLRRRTMVHASVVAGGGADPRQLHDGDDGAELVQLVDDGAGLVRVAEDAPAPAGTVMAAHGSDLRS